MGMKRGQLTLINLLFVFLTLICFIMIMPIMAPFIEMVQAQTFCDSFCDTITGSIPIILLICVLMGIFSISRPQINIGPGGG